MNIVFFGTPEIAVPFLEVLHHDPEITISAVITQPDKPVGSKKTLTPSPVKVLAQNLHLPILEPTSLKKEGIRDRLMALHPDLFVIVAYGKIIPSDILAIPKRGSINMHPSKLPKWRGPSPLQAVIEAGDKISAVSIMLIDEEMDHGPLLAQEDFEIPADATPHILSMIVQKIGPSLLLDAIKRFAEGHLKPTQQAHDQATFCKLISRENGEIDWQNDAEELERKSRAYTPWPGLWTLWQGKRLKIHAWEIVDRSLEPGLAVVENQELIIGTKNKSLRILRLQIEGKSTMDTATFLRGYAQGLQSIRLGE